MTSLALTLTVSLCLISTDRLFASCALEGEFFIGGDVEPYLLTNETVVNLKMLQKIPESSVTYKLYKNAHNQTFTDHPGEITHAFDPLADDGDTDDKLHSCRWEIAAPVDHRVHLRSLHYEIYANTYDVEDKRLRPLLLVYDGDNVVYRLGEDTLDRAVSGNGGKLVIVVAKPKSLWRESNVVVLGKLVVRYDFVKEI